MPQHWIEPQALTPPPDLVKAVGGHPLVAGLLANRGILDPDRARAFLNPSSYTPAPPADLPGVPAAVGRINRAIEAQETILVWGDFDVDGQTSTTLLVEALHDLGAMVVYHIPVRAIEGHGIMPDVLRALLGPDPPHPHPFPILPPTASTPTSQPPTPSLLLTCDTGIAEVQAVETAQSLGLDVIITDHHELPERLPQAEAVINPHMLPEGHPLSTLPGVGVVYKLVEGLYHSRNRCSDVERYLDLVALGIVADVVGQTDDARYLLQRGLQVLRRDNRPGLAALFRVANLSPASLDESHLGFSIGPRLNALGRLEDANPIVEFFTTQDTRRAEYLALHLDSLNLERRQHTDRVYRGALDLIRLDPSLENYSALVMAQPGWPAGIIGIVASRLVDRFGVPTILLNIGEDGIARGSARSVEGLHLTEAIAAQADLLIGFGGHAGAAGLSLNEKDIPEFRSRLSRTIKGMTAHLDLQPKVVIDAHIPLKEVDLSFVDDLERLAPFGAGNPQPVLVSASLRLVSLTRVGRESEHLRLILEDSSGNDQEVIHWRGTGDPMPGEGEVFDLAYHARSSTFQGLRRLQLEWVDYRIREGPQEGPHLISSKIELVDYRYHSDPLRLLNALRARSDIQVWAEGAGRIQVGGTARGKLKKGCTLVIWTTPPSYRTLRDVLHRVNPETVYVFAVQPWVDDLQPFLDRLVGLVKYLINRQDGRGSLAELAAAMAHTADTVMVGLRRLQAMDLIEVEINPQDKGSLDWEEKITLSWASDREREDLESVDRILKTMLSETAAYRAYFQKADLSPIVNL